MGSGTLRVAAWAAVVGLGAAGGTIALAGPWDGGQRAAERRAAAARERHLAEDARAEEKRKDGGEQGSAADRRPAPRVLSALDGARPALPVPTAGGLDAALGRLLESPDLGTWGSAAVADAATGQLLYGRREGTPTVPASTIKIATTVAALRVLGTEHRIPTTVVRGADAGEIVLVGGGDPTLTARPGGGPDAPASLPELARATAVSLRDQGLRTVRLAYDTSLYTGGEIHPIGPGNENIAPVTALMADEGRVDPATTGYAARVADPAADAAASFARLLEKEGVEVAGRPAPGRAPTGSEARLAEVRSQPVRELVERTLTDSDNQIAEALARQTALATGHPASFDGAGRAVTEVLQRAGIDVGGAAIRDGSGLDRSDAVSARFLTELLALASSPDHPELRPVLTGLPVAGFTGTLRTRYPSDGRGPTGAAAGVVRAKTGTLTGVNTLAGTAVDRDGRLLVFAFTARDTGDAARATAVLDRLAAAVAGCGCR